jgi:hypothetical protein
VYAHRQMTQISVTGNLMTCLMMMRILRLQLHDKNDTSAYMIQMIQRLMRSRTHDLKKNSSSHM